MGLLVLPLAARLVGQSLTRPNLSIFASLVFMVTADSLATVAVAYGMQRIQVSLVTVLGSLYEVIAVLLATVLLRERLALHQWVAVGLALLNFNFASTGVSQDRARSGP